MVEEPVAFGPFSLDPASGTLSRDGNLVPAGHRALLLLADLLRFRGEVRTKAVLMEAAWPGMAVEESNLSVQIAALRKLLGLSPDGSEWIETIPRVGYRFVAGRNRTAGPDRMAPDFFPALAVLPFVNLSGDPEQDYFADGVVEDIITALSRFRSFAVIARNSSFVYKGRAADVRRVAEELGVRYVLEGSVRRAGERLRIAAQLVDGASGIHLWAQTFDGAVGEVFDFQDHITANVALVVEPHIQIAEIERARRERPRSVAAYDVFLSALPCLYRETDADSREAYRLFTKAIEIEPDNAVFLVHAAWTIGHRRTMGWPPLGADDIDTCIAMTRRGLDLSPGDPTIMARGAAMLLHAGRDYDWAMALVRAAVAANPHSLPVVGVAGVVHLHAGSVEEALACFRRASRLSPRDPLAHYHQTGVAHAEMVLGDYPAALASALSSLSVNANYPPTYWILIAANAHLDRLDEAHRLLGELRRLVPDASIARIWAGQPQKDPSRLAAILDGLRSAGLEEG